jgi:hypothetical protein
VNDYEAGESYPLVEQPCLSFIAAECEMVRTTIFHMCEMKCLIILLIDGCFAGALTTF